MDFLVSLALWFFVFWGFFRFIFCWFGCFCGGGGSSFVLSWFGFVVVLGFLWGLFVLFCWLFFVCFGHCFCFGGFDFCFVLCFSWFCFCFSRGTDKVLLSSNGNEDMTEDTKVAKKAVL